MHSMALIDFFLKQPVIAADRMRKKLCFEVKLVEMK